MDGPNMSEIPLLKAKEVMKCNTKLLSLASSQISIKAYRLELGFPCPNVSTTLIRQWGTGNVPLCVVQLKGKPCRKPHCRNGVAL